MDYTLPDFYMPWPARLSPHLESTRAHTKAWARELGMFDPGDAAGWTEERYDRSDFPLFVALVHPDAGVAQLEAMTDFYTWSFYFDDVFFKTFTPSGDLAGARACVGRMPDFMPVDGSATPTPASPAECALADTWSRIAPAMSREWRVRLHRDIQGMNEAWLWELANAIEDRVAEPVDYIEMRRTTGGVFWAADFVEYALAIELPARIYGSRPIRVLNDVFCDTVLLRKDIVSLRKELADGESNNAVLVALEFLHCDVQQAVDVVNDVVTARLALAEHVMTCEVGPLLDEHALDPHERAAVLAYVQGLRDAMAGDFQWETGTGRYSDGPPAWLPRESPVAGWIPTGPRGLGTAAARVGLDARMIGLRARAGHAPIPSVAAAFELPALALPYTARCNPSIAALRTGEDAWPRAMGMLETGGWGVWDGPRLRAMDLARFTASTHPDAGAADLALVHDWHVWAFYFDDFFVTQFKRTRDLAGARALVARLGLFMAEDPPAPALNPVERGLGDLWIRSGGTLRTQLAPAIHAFAESWLWEIANLAGGRVPELVDYVAMRRRTGRSAFAAALVRHVLGVTLALQLSGRRALRVVHDTFADIGALHNDLVSYPVEIEREGECSNAVLAVERFLDCDPGQAAEIVARLAGLRILALEHTVAGELARLLDEHPEERDGVDRYVRALQDWLAGALAWSLASGRYDRREPAVARWLAATGLGTDAARVRWAACAGALSRRAPAG